MQPSRPDGAAASKARQLPPAVTVAQLSRWIVDSGIISSTALQSLIANMPAPKRDDARLVSQELIRQNKLTAYQVNQLYQGRGVWLVLGNYVIADKLGSGGMGVVYKAQHRVMKREVALKVLSADVMRSPDAVARFHREVIATAKLSDPNIVAAFDAAQDKGMHFLVMEYVEGRDLVQIVKGAGPMPAGPAADAILQAAKGLAHAHDAGIIHRDIKPGNLLLDGKGVIKILDLGLARFTDPDNASAAQQLTQDTKIYGTCDFMSPEQAANTSKVDGRADIYSLGATLFYLATSQTMYPGANAIEKLLGHRADPIPSLRKAKSEVPKALEAIYQKMVAKKPEDRYPSMHALIAELEPVVASIGGSPEDRKQEFLRLGKAAGIPSLATASLADTQIGDKSTRTSNRRKFSPSRKRWGWVAAAILLVTTLIAGTIYLIVRSTKQSAPAVASKSIDKPPATVAVVPPNNPPQAEDAWRKEVAAAAPTRQIELLAQRLKELNPEFDGKVDHQVENGNVIDVRFSSEFISDISPLKALPALQRLDVHYAGAGGGRGRLSNLAALKGMQLTSLNISRTQVHDLTPLKDMPLHRLEMRGIQASDFSVLQDMPLVDVGIAPNQARRHTDLLRSIKTLKRINGTPVVDFLKQGT